MKSKPKHLLTFPVIVCILIVGASPLMGTDTKSICKGRRLSALSFNLSDSQLGANFFTPGRGSEDIYFWSLDDGGLKNIIELEKGESARLITFSHNGNLMAVADAGCYSFKENRWLWKFKWLDDRPTLDEIYRLRAESMIFARDDMKILVAGSAYLIVYDSKTGDVLEKRRDPFKDYPILPGCEIRSAFSPSGRYLAIWQEFSTAAHGQWWKRSRVNKSVTIWDIEENKLIAHWRKQQSEACTAVFSADEKEIAFCSKDGYIRVWSIKEQKVIRQWEAYSKSKGSKGYPFPEVHFLASSPDGKYLATKGVVDNGHAVKIWDFLAGKLIREFKMESGGLNCGYPMAFSPDGEYFTFERCGNLCLYDTQTWQERWCVPTSADGKD